MKGKYGNKRSLDVLVYIMQTDLMERQEVLPRRLNFSTNAFPGKNLSSKMYKGAYKERIPLLTPGLRMSYSSVRYLTVRRQTCLIFRAFMRFFGKLFQLKGAGGLWSESVYYI